MVKIRDFMSTDLVTADSKDSVKDVAARMSAANIGAVAVTEGGKLSAVFSERDLLNRVVAEGRDPETTSIGEVATNEVVSVSVDSTLRQCTENLKVHNVRHMFIVEGDRPVGIISARDCFEVVAGRLEAWIERARYDEQLRENVDPYDHLGGSYGK